MAVNNAPMNAAPISFVTAHEIILKTRTDRMYRRLQALEAPLRPTWSKRKPIPLFDKIELRVEKGRVQELSVTRVRL